MIIINLYTLNKFLLIIFLLKEKSFYHMIFYINK